jgi:hypothetical protein
MKRGSTGGLMVPLTPRQTLQLLDGQDQPLGQVIVDRVEGDLVCGRFLPAAGYARVQQLFADSIRAANEGVLAVVGELDEAIGALGLHLSSSDGNVPASHDDQIGDGSSNFRVQAAEPEPRTSARAPAAPLHPDPRPVEGGHLVGVPASAGLLAADRLKPGLQLLGPGGTTGHSSGG